MKIAACLSGNPRTFTYCRPYIENFFQGCQVDWFAHAWPHEAEALADVPLQGLSTQTLPPQADLLEQKALSRFREYCFIRLIPMYWGISQVISLVKENEYDLIVRIRPDVVPHQLLSKVLPFHAQGQISFAYHMQTNMRSWSPPVRPPEIPETAAAGFNDLLFYGAPLVMKKFEKSYDWISDFIAHPDATHFTASQLLQYFVHDRLQVPAKRGPLSLYLIGEDHTRSEIQNYRHIDRSRARRQSDIDYIQQKYSVIAPWMSRPIQYTAPEMWLEKCWSDDPADPSTLLGYNI